MSRRVMSCLDGPEALHTAGTTCEDMHYIIVGTVVSVKKESCILS